MKIQKIDSVLTELLDILDYLAPPSPTKEEPTKRARCGIESDEGGRWDGGKCWRRTDARISRVVKQAQAILKRKE